MREILFRGIKCDLRNNHFTKDKWAFGSLQNWGNNECSILSTANKKGESTCYYIDPETVGQYTGLTDKNGTKIFEGDIIKFCRGLKKAYFVEFDSGRFVLTRKDAHCELFEISICPCEVIGNIYDNPELSEVKTNDKIEELPLLSTHP